MKRTLLALTALCGAALIATPAFALAQDDDTENAGPGTVACEEADATVRARAAAIVPIADDIAAADESLLGLEQDVDAAITAAIAAQVALAAAEESDAELLAELNTDVEVALTAVQTSGQALFAALDGDDIAVVVALRADLDAARAALDVAIGARDEACTAPAGETPTTTPEVPAPVDEFDCSDFPLTDGRTAQDILDGDAADPNRLDLDGDGQACELDDTDPATDDSDFDQVGTPPAGGVATGG